MRYAFIILKFILEIVDKFGFETGSVITHSHSHRCAYAFSKHACIVSGSSTYRTNNIESIRDLESV